ncbi:hypothetical protein GCM10027515_32300 [Schumannella luteola]|uniref:Uncharacterized protein n=1 Tax=Schumannella luteola TaxID=472059 RepID=A0A852YCB0_9MICO|nr:hypothetical protein [Schumannella luteola]NYG98970.1 hypothetical protein [Schumannella luteola]
MTSDEARAARRVGTAPLPRRVTQVVDAAERQSGQSEDALAAIRTLHRGLGLRRVLLGALALATAVLGLLVGLEGVVDGGDSGALTGGIIAQLVGALLMVLVGWSNARMIRALGWWMRLHGSLRGLGADDPDAARLFAFEPFVFWRGVGAALCLVLGLTGAASAAVIVRDLHSGLAFAIFGVTLLVAGVLQFRALSRIVAARLALGRRG